MTFATLRNLISASGGRKAFYCFFIVIISALMLAFQRLTGMEFSALVGGTFTVLSASNSYEAVQESKAQTAPDSINVQTEKINVNVADQT